MKRRGVGKINRGLPQRAITKQCCGSFFGGNKVKKEKIYSQVLIYENEGFLAPYSFDKKMESRDSVEHT